MVTPVRWVVRDSLPLAGGEVNMAAWVQATWNAENDWVGQYLREEHYKEETSIFRRRQKSNGNQRGVVAYGLEPVRRQAGAVLAGGRSQHALREKETTRVGESNAQLRKASQNPADACSNASFHGEHLISDRERGTVGALNGATRAS